MLIIAIDEYGHFNYDEGISFVGGYIYTGEDYIDERERLFKFLKETCEGFNLKFPMDMHYDRYGRNKRQVQYFEKNIERPLKEYLIQNGKYHLTGMVKSRKERKDYINISNLVDDTKANNLYEHMVSSILRNMLFNNIDTMDKDRISIEIPTRVSVVEGSNVKKLDEFMTLGYEGKLMEGSNKYIFYSTDQKTFKTALSSMFMNSHRKYNTKFESINIKSINYRDESVDMAYLYLADIICNSFKHRINMNRQDYGIQSLNDWAKNFTGGNEAYLWAYDDIDSLHNDIIRKYEAKDFVETLRLLYKAKNTDSDFTRYYNENWFNKIEKNIHNAFDIRNIDVYISQLDAFYKKDYINNDMGAYIFDNLWNIVLEQEDKINKKSLYNLADVGIRVYNHQGIGSRENPYYKICEELKVHVPIETYIDTLNRSIQAHVNDFNFDKAIEVQIYTLECINILKKAIIDISELQDTDSNVSAKITSRGRALSSLGQFYAFKRNPKALGYFEEALEEFGDDEGNCQITISHILNFASDQGDLQLFEKYAPRYFGGADNIYDQLSYLEGKDAGRDFNIYTYVKALNLLYIDKIDYNLLKRIIELDFKKLGYKTVNHPWELIYKNIGMILDKRGNTKLAIKYMDRAIECISNPSGTIGAINHFTNIQKKYFTGNAVAIKKSIEDFKLWLENEPIMKEYFKYAFVGNIEEIYNNLYNKFTFTYI